MNIYKDLSDTEIEEFKQWARDNFTPKMDKVSTVWHPVVRQECLKMYGEVFPHLMFCHLGNGIVVCDTNVKDGTDYVRIAHITSDRNVKLNRQLVSINDMRYIELYANIADPNISVTRDNKVFNQRPFGL